MWAFAAVEYVAGVAAQRESYQIPQALADRWALAAQEFAGYFYGKKVRAGQYGTTDNGRVFVSDEDWTVPYAEADDCDFCAALTDERVVDRIDGFQRAIDVECRRPVMGKWMKWYDEHRGQEEAVALRGFFEHLIADGERLEPEPLAIVQLPFYMKRRLCIIWNHILREYINEHAGYSYDFEKRRLVYHVPAPATPAARAAQAEREDLADDIAYAATLPSDLGVASLDDEIADEYEAGLF